MLAWMLSRNQDRFNQWSSLFKAVAIVSLPAALVLLQPDAGTVLVFTGLILCLPRRAIGQCSDCRALRVARYNRDHPQWASTVHYPGAGEATGAWILWVILLALGAFLRGHGAAVDRTPERKRTRRAVLFSFAAALVLSAGLQFGLEEVLRPHQRDRIHVLFGIDVGNPDADYNIRHAKAAISSGGVTGERISERPHDCIRFRSGARNGLHFLHNRRRVGVARNVSDTASVHLLLLRILALAERQRSDFTRIYAYAVASILFMHYAINVGMVLGLAPVIGIPLPFISAGGSSLTGFTLLVFILLRLDAERFTVLR